VRTEGAFAAGSLADVQVILLIYGLALRIGGITEWTTRDHLLGIRFMHPSARSKNQLAALLTCLVDKSAAEMVKAAVISSPQPASVQFSLSVEQSEAQQPAVNLPAQHEERPIETPPPQTEGPVHDATAVCMDPEAAGWPAVLRVLKEGVHFEGTLRGLEMEGCEFRTLKPFLGGIHLRVEVLFQLFGLTCQLQGVTEEILDKQAVTIRFLEMSRRKHEELEQIIEELSEAKKKTAAEAGAQK